jgi:PST family polysaccharide transporter
VLSLGTVQFALIVLPLITLPYLARVLDRGELGIVVFVQSFSFVVALVVDYGFNLSAPRHVATRKDDPGALASTVAGVYGAKMMLSAGAVVLSVAVLPTVPVFQDSPGLMAAGVALGLSQGFFPMWFFLGMERAHVAALVELAWRLIGLLLIVLLVREGDDASTVIAIYLVTSVASTALLTVIVFRSARALMPSSKGSLEALRAGRTVFIGTGATALYTGANPFLLGLLVPVGQVALFATAEKTVRAAARVLGLLSAAVYPRVSSLLDRGNVELANRLLSISLLLFGGAALATAGALALAAPAVVEFVFGSRFEAAAPLLRTLALVLPLNVVGVTIGTQYLLSRGRDRRLTSVLLVACVTNAALVLTTAGLLDLKATAGAVVLVELLVVLGYATAMRRVTTAPAPPEPTVASTPEVAAEAGSLPDR